MAKISLATYTMRIRKENDPTSLIVNEFAERTDFYDFMIEYLSELKEKISHNVDDKRLLRVIDFSKNIPRRIVGHIESGFYGYTSELYDVLKERTSYRRKTEEAELLPFYFLFDISKGFDEAIVILQRFANFGVRKVLLDDLRNRFRSKYPDYIIDINPLVPDSFYEEYLTQGRVTKIKFRKFSVDPDIANNFDSSDHREQIGYTDLVITAHRNKQLPLLNRIKRFRNGKLGVKEFFDIRFFQYDNIQIEMVKNGNKRTLDLSEMNRIRAYFDITDKVRFNENGHPQMESINKEAESLLIDLKKALKRG